jgi:predicted nuclease of restriction endonuclease-like RecB superfamily
MLPTDLLISRRNGDTLIPKRLGMNQDVLFEATEQINCFQSCVGSIQSELNEKLLALEGDSPDYKLKRGFAHLLKSHFSTFEIISPLEPEELRQKVFAQSATIVPIPQNRPQILETLARQLSQELNREVFPIEIEKGLYADLPDNRILTQFEAPTPETLIHRYNLSQVQGIFYRASHIIINAHRNDPGEYKLLFKYLKLFQLMAYIEGDSDTGFTITIDGPTSLFQASTRYGLAIAKMIPALLHVSKWNLKAGLQYKDTYTKVIRQESFSLDDQCNLVSHYPPQKPYDSMLEMSFATRWAQLKTEWQLEREVDLIPLPGSVMIPDFRLIHPDGRDYLLEIVGYWRPEYLQKKFSQVRRAEVSNLILAVSERLNLEKAGVKINDVPAKVIWFKDKLSPQAVLDILEK